MSARCGALDGWRGLGEAAHRAHTVRFTPPPRPSRRPPTSAAPTRSRMAWGPCQSSPGGAPTRHRPPARPRLPSLAHNGRPAAHPARLPTAPGPAVHWLPICPQPTCPSPSRAHLTGCRLAAGGPDRRRGSETPLAGLGGPGSLCGASLLVPLGCLPRQQRFSCLFQPFLCRLQPFQRRPAGLGDGLGRPGVADVEWVGLGGSGRCCLGREASAISVDRWGKPQNWPRQSPGTRRGIAPLPARRMARFDRLTRFF